MVCAQLNKSRFVALLVFMSFCMTVGVGLCDARDTDGKDLPLGKLKLEGKDVDYLALQRRGTSPERITRPEETIELPEGQYQLQEVRLKGGYTYRSLGVSGGNCVTVTVDKPATLKVGGPLVPTVKVQRQGRILRLSYELQGIGSETYTGGDRSKPPTFAVYKGQKKIASGKFEFG